MHVLVLIHYGYINERIQERSPSNARKLGVLMNVALLVTYGHINERIYRREALQM